MSVKNIMKAILPKYIISLFRSIINTQSNVNEIRDMILAYQTNQLQQSNRNPLNSFGKKCFSQTDEDGITLEILKRLNCIEGGTFAEFGVGNGTENNTLILKALGWKGFWVGGEDLVFPIKQPKQSFIYIKDWVTLDNILSLTSDGIKKIGSKEIDVISLDLDGNDIYFVDKLLANGYLPKLFIVEYNAKFPPPVKWQIDYNPKHFWQGDDYFGASLSSYIDLFKKYGFLLVCCNSHTGANAFFIRGEYSEKFKDIPQDIESIYVAPRYYLYHSFGHKNSIKTIEKLFL
ncbi:hypothetical protein [Fluviispira vulneris]|uniref:hypothetical protein n=1 Tax=Fluviispira vulneris TaxID=2763012 RepID=UPI001C94D960|nr:hypothetical protein [Fluviispira vulneris]